MNFWSNLKQPFFILAPMANVTDAAFRRLIAKYGKPDVLYTEFVSADGLCSRGKEKIYEASALIKKLGFDGLDINMGCPDRTVEKQGAGAALMKNPKLARQIIHN